MRAAEVMMNEKIEKARAKVLKGATLLGDAQRILIQETGGSNSLALVINQALGVAHELAETKEAK